MRFSGIRMGFRLRFWFAACLLFAGTGFLSSGTQAQTPTVQLIRSALAPEVVEGTEGAFNMFLRPNKEAHPATVVVRYRATGTATRNTDYRWVCGEPQPGVRCSNLVTGDLTITLTTAQLRESGLPDVARIEAITDSSSDDGETVVLTDVDRPTQSAAWTIKDPAPVKLGFIRNAKDLYEAEAAFTHRVSIRMSSIYPQDITIPLTYGSSGTATSGTDYQQVGSVTIRAADMTVRPGGSAQGLFYIAQILPNRESENNETFTVTLNLAGATPAGSVTGLLTSCLSGNPCYDTLTATILDAGVVSFVDGATSTVSEEGGPHQIRLSRSKTHGTAHVQYQVSGTARLGDSGDFTPVFSTIADGNYQLPKWFHGSDGQTLTLNIHDDECAEGPETIQVRLVDAVGIGVFAPQGAAAVHTVTIEDDDTVVCRAPSRPVTDLMPSFGASAVADQNWTRGEAITPLSLPVATGGDGTLTYSLSPAPPAGMTLDTSARSLSGAPEQAQEATRYTWTATDADGDAVTLEFTIAVTENIARMQDQVIRPALAAMARLSLSSALENIGSRFGDFGADDLTLAGHAVPMSATGLPEALRPCSPVLTDPAATSSTDCRFHSRGWSSAELLHASDFSLSLEASDPASGAARWSIWGRGDWGSFTGNGTEPQTRHEGELQSGWLGLDARVDHRVMGLAFSRSQGETDYTMETDEGRLETTLNGVYPYGRWTLNNGLELRAVLGAGEGEARHQPQGGEAMSSDLLMWMGSVGVRRPLAPADGIDLALRLEASRARLRTAAGRNPIDGLVADSWRLRAGMEASKRFIRANGAELEPFLEASVRRDRGDGLEGGGIELTGGLRYGRPGLSMEARGRWLAAHQEKGARESGASVTVRGGAGAGGRGLWFTLQPRWGAGTGSLALWNEEAPRMERDVSAAHSLDARLGYGMTLPDAGGVLTPFTGAVLSGEDRRVYQVGTRFDSSLTDFGMEVVGERTEDADASNAPEHTLKFNLRYRF